MILGPQGGWPADRREERELRRHACVLCAVVMLFMPAPSPAYGVARPLYAQASAAATIHVGMQIPAASDSNPGTEGLPLKTISRAVQLASRSATTGRPITILVHPGVYRETVTITTPLTLTAEPGAEIRGSDVWSTGWSRAGPYWTHPGVPSFHTHGPCDRESCKWPELVFYDGKPLLRVATSPAKGQFAITADRALILADPPEGHTVEVTVRTAWITIRSNSVTVRGFTMKHAANDAQTGAIHAHASSDVAVIGNVLSDTNGAVLFFGDGSTLRITGNDISRGGQLGIALSGDADVIVSENRIHENNTKGFDSGWEAGGLKATRAVRLTVDANEVYENDGPGLWCDGDCQDVVFSNNRIHDNTQAGIQYEISRNARIFNNVVWGNGLAYGLNSNHWGWGAGILVQNSNGCQVFRNTLAWNINGITVLEQPRGPGYLVFNTSIHDNSIVSQDALTGGIVYALGWMADHPTKMFAPSQDNRAWSNRYGYSGAESGPRFAWGGASYGRIADFNATPGGKDGRYLTVDEQRAMLSTLRVPLSP